MKYLSSDDITSESSKNKNDQEREPLNLEKSEIKIIEDLSLNAWPSHQMQLYDGWILRYSSFYTHRTNCVEQIGKSMIPTKEKIRYCEEIYGRWNTPCIFKITPLVDPAFDEMLEKRGYEVQHATTVMQMGIAPAEYTEDRKIPEQVRICVENRISDEWIDALFTIKGDCTVIHMKIVPSMYAAIPKDVICVSARVGRKIIATGLGILDRDYIGIYAINVDKRYRRLGIARRICGTLLMEGSRAGAERAYLQVVSDNEKAIRLYRSLGFSAQYDYWFRVKEIE